MADVLTARSAFAGVPLVAGRRITLAEAPDAARYSLRGPVAAAAALASHLGLDVPAHNRAVSSGGATLIALGPDEWLLLVEGGGHSFASLDGTIAGPHALTEISDRNVGLDISGRVATLVLNAGNPLDLAIDAFPIGMATRTLIGKAEVVLWRQAGDRFHVEVWRSFAPYLAGFLMEAAREYL